MYATKRSVRKAQGVEKKGKEPKHNNGKITEGREHRIQLIKDEHGFIKKRIVHYSPKKLLKIQKYNKMLEEYKKAMQEESEKQFEGENDVKGVGEFPAGDKFVRNEEQPVTDIVEAPAEVIATE